MVNLHAATKSKKQTTHGTAKGTMISIPFMLGMVSNQINSQGGSNKWQWSPNLSKLNNLGKLSFRVSPSLLIILEWISRISSDFPMFTNRERSQTVVPPVTRCSLMLCFLIFPSGILVSPHPSWYPFFSTNHVTSWQPSDPNGSHALVYSMDVQQNNTCIQ